MILGNDIVLDLTGIKTVHQELEKKSSKRKDFLIQTKKYISSKGERWLIKVINLYDSNRVVEKIDTSVNKFLNRLENTKKYYRNNYFEDGDHIATT